MSKIKSRWMCFCVMSARDVMRDDPHRQNYGGADEVRESAVNALISTSSSIHQKKAVNISSSRSGGLRLQLKKRNFLRRFLKRITKRSSSMHLFSTFGAPNPEQRLPPGGSYDSTDSLMISGSPKTTFYSIDSKPEINPNPVSEVSSQRHGTEIISDLPPAVVAPPLERRQVRSSSSVFAWTCGPRKIEDFVVMDGTLLGKGSYGSVRLCSNKGTGHLMACKTIDKVKMENSYYDLQDRQACMIRREVKMHQLCLDHPNVVQMLGLFEDDAAVHILMEYCDAGCLSEILRRYPRGLPVNTAAVGMKQLAEALCWIHGKNIVHRDIKPENILVAAHGRRVARLKVGDFGFACQLKPEQGTDSVLMRPRSRCGSPGYMAPEVQRKEAYGTAVDIWSAGVVLCKMLTRDMPFHSYDDLQVVRNLDFSLPHWKHVPDEARHLVSRMLEYNPQKRITAAQILENAWIKEHNEM